MTIVVTVVLLALAAECHLQSPAPVNEAEIDRIMRDYAGAGAPGAGVLVLRDGQVILRKAYGLADVENGVGAATDTNYRLASVTKAFTAAAILRLADSGKLSLDDRVTRYLPELPEESAKVTIRHLLTHTSGIVDYEDVIPAGTAAQLLDRDVLEILRSQRSLYFTPGSSYRYSNSGYALLALIVERVSERSFTEYLDAEIFEPLGMRGSVAHREGTTTVARRAYGHRRDGSSWVRSDQSLTSAVLGDGGVYSSVDDLAQWLTALDGGAFAEAAVPRTATDDPAIRYGYGWRITERHGHRVVMHTGETIGFRNAVVRFPDRKLSVVVLTNRDEGVPLDLAFAIAQPLIAPDVSP